MEIGASFAHPHLSSMGYDPQKVLEDFAGLGLGWIRLGCYWNEIEPQENNYDFSQLDPLIKFCEHKKIKVVLTVGMKAPRYPEYYVPDWVDPKQQENLVLKFIQKCIDRYKNYNCIKVWQIENEPFDPAGPKWQRLTKDLLQKECDLVRNIDPKRKILINLWGNELSKRKEYKKALDIADIAGFDFYLRHPLPFLKWLRRYFGPLDSVKKIKQIVDEIKSQKKDFWIVELQTEPWEPEETLTNKKNPKSFLPEHFQKNLAYGTQFEPSVILLWGFEWWYHKKQCGDNRYWDEAKKLIASAG